MVNGGNVLGFLHRITVNCVANFRGVFSSLTSAEMCKDRRCLAYVVRQVVYRMDRDGKGISVQSIPVGAVNKECDIQ